MSATERRKGAAYERQLAAYLRALGVPAERTSRGTHQDTGDLTNTLGLHLEAKNQARLDLAGWVDQAHRDAAGSGRTPVVVIKRRGVLSPARHYAVLTLGDLLHLLGTTDPDKENQP